MRFVKQVAPTTENLTARRTEPAGAPQTVPVTGPGGWSALVHADPVALAHDDRCHILSDAVNSTSTESPTEDFIKDTARR